MGLELASFPVRRARFGPSTRYLDGELTIDRETVRELVLPDPRISRVDPEIIHPGDPVRVLRVLDAVEPLAKIRGPGSTFPGFNGPPETCGSGRTHRLEGFTVVQVSEFPFPAAGVHAFEEGIIEMAGPGALYSGCSDRVNLVLAMTPGAVSSNEEYDDAMRRATLRVAGFLAESTRELVPPCIETFALNEVRSHLPRIVWLHQIRAQGPMVQTFLYSQQLTGMVPTILHPNELLDGALVGGNYKIGTRIPTYVHTRHPSLLAMYKRHGHSLTFAGVILARGHHESESLKARSAHFVAKLAQILGANGALCTYEATGNTHVDFMLTVQALERAAIPAASAVHEYGGPQGIDPTLVDFVPEAIALASSGAIDRWLRLPPVHRVIGGTHLAHRGELASGELNLPIHELYAATAEMNIRGIVAEEY
jgi:glycine reductase